MWDSKTRNIQLLTFQWKRSIWQNPDKTEPIRMLWFCSRLKKINNKYSWLWNTTCIMCQLWLQRYNISHHTIHILIQAPQYDTLTGKKELPRMDKPCVLSVGVQDVSWQLIETVHAFVTPSWKTCDQKHAKQYKAKVDFILPFPGPFFK